MRFELKLQKEFQQANGQVSPIAEKQAELLNMIMSAEALRGYAADKIAKDGPQCLNTSIKNWTKW